MRLIIVYLKNLNCLTNKCIINALMFYYKLCCYKCTSILSRPVNPPPKINVIFIVLIDQHNYTKYVMCNGKYL